MDGDPAALRRALSNLIANAVKFGGSARVASSRDGAVVMVEDDGPGLPEELEAVFEPFTAPSGPGTGRQAARPRTDRRPAGARAFGGDVTLANRPGGGLAARLELPLPTERA